MWTTTAEERLKELGFTIEQINRLSDKTRVGVNIITEVLLEAMKDDLIVKKSMNGKKL